MIFHSSSYFLNDFEKKEVVNFVINNPNFSIEQIPCWYSNSNKKYKYHHFILNEELIAVCTVIETRKWLARIQFGPLLIDEIYFEEVVKLLNNYYRKEGFIQLFIQSNKWLQGSLTENFNVNSWSTLLVDLTPNNPYDSFSKHHNRLISKAKSLGLEFREISLPEISDFTGGMIDMYNSRKLDATIFNETDLRNKYNNLKMNQIGDFWGVFLNSKLIGGVIIIYNNKTSFYYQGFSNHSLKQIPILHFAFGELVMILKSRGFKALDLGGYNRFAKKNDQIYNINKFKLGFTRNIVDYQPQIEIIYKPIQFNILKILKRLKTILHF